MAAPLVLTACTVDLDRREVRRGGAVLPLSELEALLLAWLSAHPGEPADRDRLLVEVWGFPRPVRTRAVDNTVSRLRHKIEADPAEPDHLKTVRGRGYLLEGAGTSPTSPAPPTAPSPAARRLPAPPTAFIGRANSLSALESLVAGGARLVTVQGLGGMGKSRLVARWLEQTATPIFAAVALAEAGSRPALLAEVGGALGVPLSGDAEVDRDRIGRALARRGPGVLVLDNLEQLRDALPDTLGAWLRQAPALSVVATSRSRLRLSGERALPLPPLSEADARALLRDRLGADALPEEAAGVLARLGSHPLSIELFAGRCASFPLPQLAQRLERALLSVLSAGPQDALPRHRSLEATLRWSWALLSPDEQRALAACGALSGPFDLDLAEVLLDFGAPAPDALALLGALCDASLVQREQARYRLLPAVQAFARARLAEQPERGAMQQRAARFLLARTLRSRRDRFGPARRRCRAALRADRPHLVPLARAVADAEPVVAVQLVVSAALDEGIQHLPDAAVLRWAVGLAERSGDLDALTDARIMLCEWHRRRSELDAAAAALDDARIAERSRVLSMHVVLHAARGQHEACRELCELLLERPDLSTMNQLRALAQYSNVLALLGQRDDAHRITRSLRELAAAHRHQTMWLHATTELAALLWEDPAQEAAAKALLEEALETTDPDDPLTRYSTTLTFSAWVSLLAGELDAAQRLGQQAVDHVHRTGDLQSEGVALGMLIWAAALRGDLDENARLLDEALRAARQKGNPVSVSALLASQGLLAVRRGEPERAAERFAAVDACTAGASIPADLALGMRMLRAGLDHYRDPGALLRRWEAEAAAAAQRSSYLRLVGRLLAIVAQQWRASYQR